MIVKGKPHAVDVEQKSLFVLGHIFQIELVAEFNHLLRRKTAQEHRVGRHIQEILLKIVYYIDALVCGARKRLYGADVFVHSAVIKFLR